MPPTRPESTDTSPPDPASGSTRRATHGAGSNRTTTTPPGRRPASAWKARPRAPETIRAGCSSRLRFRLWSTPRTVSRACANRKTLGFPTLFRARPLRSPFRPARKPASCSTTTRSLRPICRCCSAADGARRSPSHTPKRSIWTPPRCRKETGTRSKARNSSDTRTSFCPTAAATGCSRRFGGGRGVTCS